MNAILAVFKKEVRDILRDKRSRSAMVVGPFFSVFLMFALFGIIGASVKKAATTTIHVVGKPQGKIDEAIVNAMKKGEIKVEEVATVEAGEKLIKDGKARLVLDFGTGLEQNLAAGKGSTLKALFDPGEQKAQIALSVIETVIGKVNDGVLEQLLTKNNLDKSLVRPISVERVKVKVGETSTAEVLVQLIPDLIIIWAFYGGMSIASDIVSGEKERQTLETLLISPTSRLNICLGKLLALAAACSVATLSAFIALIAGTKLPLPGMERLLEGGLQVSATGALVMLLVLLPTIALFASMLLAVSAFAKNTREAQTYLAQASFVVVLPAVFSQVIGLTDAGSARWVSFVPVLNSANALRQALLGKYDGVGIAITIVLGIVLSAAALVYAIRTFNKEEVLTRI